MEVIAIQNSALDEMKNELNDKILPYIQIGGKESDILTALEQNYISINTAYI